MSEEEKNAIELINRKSLNDYFYVSCGNSIDKAIEIILKLIEKQQQEIERLKEYEWMYKDLMYKDLCD